MPARSPGSSREPVRIQKPSAIDRTEGTASVTMRTPESSSVSRGSSGTRLAVSPAAVAAPAVAALAPPAPPRGPRSAGAHLGELLGRLALDIGIIGEAEPDAAALRVDLDHLDLDLVAAVDHVLDRVDPLAGRQVGDVEQAVGALGELDEGAEGRWS